jgi:hypothetical protein
MELKVALGHEESHPRAWMRKTHRMYSVLFRFYSTQVILQTESERYGYQHLVSAANRAANRELFQCDVRSSVSPIERNRSHL